MYCRVQLLRLFAIARSTIPKVPPIESKAYQLHYHYQQFLLLSSKSILQSPSSKLINCPLFRRRFTRSSRSHQQNGHNNQQGGQDSQTKPQSLMNRLWAKFKIMYKDYWYVLVPVHLSTSACWLGGLYYLGRSGVDLAYYMKKIGLPESLVNKANSGVGHLAVAYALYKVITPVRLAVTLGGTTYAINILRNLGYIRPAREIYSKGKDRLQTMSKQIKEKKK